MKTETFPPETFPRDTFPRETFPRDFFPEKLFPEELFPEKLFPEKLFPEKLFPDTDKNGLGEKFLGGNVSGGGEVSPVSGIESSRISGFLGKFSFLDIYEMMDFTNISEILVFFVANPGILDKSMISVRFPHAKPFVNRSFPDFVISGRVPLPGYL